MCSAAMHISKSCKTRTNKFWTNIAGALEYQKGSLTRAQTSIVQLKYASMESGSDTKECEYTIGKRSSSSAGLALDDEPCAKQMKEEIQHH